MVMSSTGPLVPSTMPQMTLMVAPAAVVTVGIVAAVTSR